MSQPLTLSVRAFAPAECTDLDALLGRGPTRGRVGLALSGGGTRSAVSSIGILRALHAWGLLPHIRAISAVSGGSWAATTYTFLPPQFDEDAWLGHYIEDPAALRGGPPAGDARIDRVEPHDALFPFTRLGASTPATLAKVIAGKPQGIDGHRIWIRVIGEQVLGPWGLAAFDGRHHPTSFFAADAAEASALRAACPQLPSTVHLPRPGRPYLMINAALRVKGADGDDTLAPTRITPHFAGVIGDGIGTIDDQPVGGGAIQTAGFGGRWISGPAENPTVELRRPPSLADTMGIASSFFADALGDRGIDTVNPVIDYFGPRWTAPAASTVQAIDGGAVENTGVATLLSMQGIDALIAGVHPPNSCVFHGGDVVFDRQIAALFGYREHDKSTGWRRYDEPGGGTPDYAHNQVFAADEFLPLLDQLGARYQAGDAAVVARTHTVVDNPRFGVKGGRTVRVVWLVLAESRSWTEALHPLTRAARGPMFPIIPTTLNHMPPPVAQLLAHYTSWMLGRQRNAVEALFAPG